MIHSAKCRCAAPSAGPRGLAFIALLWLAATAWPSAFWAQEAARDTAITDPQALLAAKKFDLVRAQLELSYITVLGGAGDIQPLLFEANSAPHFAVAWRKHGFVATPKVLLRMFNDSTRSAPIRTPSFMPRLSWYYWGPPLTSNAARMDYVSLTFSHHSNGQPGPFLIPDTETPNTVDGSFSTNFFELQYHRAYGVADPLKGTWLRYGLRVHIPFNEDVELRREEGDNQYGRYRLLLAGQQRGLLPIFPGLRLPFIARADYFYILDSNFQGKPFFDWERLGLSLTWSLGVPADVPLGFFVNVYLGQDYYNIWYKQDLSIVRVGLTAQSISTLLAPR